MHEEMPAASWWPGGVGGGAAPPPGVTPICVLVFWGVFCHAFCNFSL